MGSIGRYIFRTTLGAFFVVLVSLTAVIWVTQALRDIDLMTNQGQTVLVFIGITGLIIPLLVLVIAPIALLIAVVHVLNKLSTDSEIIVMNAAGMSPWLIFRAFLSVGIVVSIIVTLIAAYFAPAGLRKLRTWLVEVQTDLVTNIVQPGRFTQISAGLTIHIRERPPNGQLLGIFIDDARNPAERLTILADEGEILKNDHGTFLVMQHGTIQRHESGQRDPNIVVFDRNAFDLSQFTSTNTTIKYSVRERYLWQLLFHDHSDLIFDEQPGEARAELHDRLVAPLYPIAFVIIAFAYLAPPRTTRQSRSMSLLGAIGAVSLLRLIGFASTVFGVHMPIALFVPYVAVAATVALGLAVIGKGIVIEPPAVVTKAFTAIMETLTRRFAPT
ncbi:MAG TPA: LPS export ABC transporter permease LptF [Pseudolabrys sp.]|nr:LPS export ABC transporter permease LptF [Pseudolabrys sp.]